MGKSEELLRLERDLNEQPELREKLDAEYKRIAEAGGREVRRGSHGEGRRGPGVFCYPRRTGTPHRERAGA